MRIELFVPRFPTVLACHRRPLIVALSEAMMSYLCSIEDPTPNGIRNSTQHLYLTLAY